MSWQIFKNEVLSLMSSGPPDIDTVAEGITNSYNKAVTSLSAGDRSFRNSVDKGNTEAMKAWLVTVLTQQSTSVVQLPIINMFVSGFIQYWTGATLKKTNLPPTPAVGATSNISVTSVIVTNPGSLVPQIYDMGGLNQIEPFLDKLINAATKHLLTVGGVVNVKALYGAPPTQTVMDGLVPWLGFEVERAETSPAINDILEQSPRETTEPDVDESVITTEPTAKEYHGGKLNKNDTKAEKEYNERLPDSKGQEFQKEDIDVYYGQDVGFAAQKTNWACLVTSLANLLKKYKIKDKNGVDVVNESTFIDFKGGYQYSDKNVAKGKYMSGNNFSSGVFFADAPKLLGGKFTRSQKNIKTKTSQTDVYEGYKTLLRAIKAPMIIRVSGTSRRPRGHFVIMVGITKKVGNAGGEIIVRDCGSQKSVRSDKTYTVGRMLAGGEADAGYNFDAMYFTKS
jgi:hypothetical protein